MLKTARPASESAACLDYDSFHNSTVIANVAAIIYSAHLAKVRYLVEVKLGLMSLQVTSTTKRFCAN
jgi:hypothetical protein